MKMKNNRERILFSVVAALMVSILLLMFTGCGGDENTQSEDISKVNSSSSAVGDVSQQDGSQTPSDTSLISDEQYIPSADSELSITESDDVSSEQSYQSEQPSEELSSAESSTESADNSRTESESQSSEDSSEQSEESSESENSKQEKVTVTGISISHAAEKTEYYLGQHVTTAGLVLKVDYSDGSSKQINSGFTTDYDKKAFEKLGNIDVAVKYESKTVSYRVGVFEKVDNPMFEVVISAPDEVKTGDKIDVFVTLTNIKSTNGMTGLSCFLSYDGEMLTPVYTDVGDDGTGFNALIHKCPMKKITVNGATVEIPAWEQMCFCDLGKCIYELRMVELDMGYAVKEDNSISFVIPFKVNANASGEILLDISQFELSGTSANYSRIEGTTNYKIIKVK